MENNFHGTDDQWEEYALGRLPDSDVSLLEQHLMVCAACQEKLNRIEAFALGMRDALASEPLGYERAAAPRVDWFGWQSLSIFRRPAFSMAFGFIALVVLVAVLSNGRTVAPSASLQLTAMRGEMPFTNPAREFDLTLSDAPRDGGPFRIEVVNAMGVSMWSGLAASTPAGVQVKLMHRLIPGDYFVRLYTGSGNLLHEYGFRIRI